MSFPDRVCPVIGAGPNNLGRLMLDGVSIICAAWYSPVGEHPLRPVAHASPDAERQQADAKA